MIIRRIILLLTTELIFSIAFSQNSETTIDAINNYNKYHETCLQDSSNKMIELKTLIRDIKYELRYASKNNFMHRRMYNRNTSYTFLRLPAAKALANIQHELQSKGLGIKVYDAYRPYSVTKEFWELVKDERYVAHPAKGSNHNRGTAIDLTIIDLKSGKELNMGTGFDNFTDTAHHTFTNLPPEVLTNRRLLRSLMEKYGFKAFDTEWWHYNYQGNKQFDVLDIPFRKLK